MAMMYLISLIQALSVVILSVSESAAADPTTR